LYYFKLIFYLKKQPQQVENSKKLNEIFNEQIINNASELGLIEYSSDCTYRLTAQGQSYIAHKTMSFIRDIVLIATFLIALLTFTKTF